MLLVGFAILSACGTETSPRKHSTGATSETSGNTSADEVSDDATAGSGPPADRNGGSKQVDLRQNDAWCEPLNEIVSNNRCERAKAFAQHLKLGNSGFRTPDHAIVGEPFDVTFAVIGHLAAPTQDANAPTLDTMLGGPASIQHELKTSRYMAATLEGASFKVEPSGRQEKDLGISDVQRWSWRVTPMQGERHDLTLSVYAVMQDEAGKPTDNLIQVMNRSIEVDIGSLPVAKNWFAAATGVTSGLAQLLTALGSVAVAAGAAWTAMRRFGRKSK